MSDLTPASCCGPASILSAPTRASKAFCAASGYRFPVTELACCIRQWQPDLKTRVAGFGIHLNIAPVLFYNPLDSVEAETGAFSDSFGGEKRLKDVRLYLRRNPWTVI